MRTALVHEFLTQLGGAERVLDAFHEIFPDAPVYTLVYDEAKTDGAFRGWDIRTSFLQKLPGGVGQYKWYLPLMPRAIESLDLSEYDLVLSDSSAMAKGVRTAPGARHICYCHTPTRYLWESMEEYVSHIKYPVLIKTAAKFYLKHFLKAWDYKAAQKPDVMIANSRTVQQRIRKYYGRKSQVIYPPVDTGFFQGQKKDGGYYLTASRLEPYKKVDIVVEAFRNLGLPLKISGSGTEQESITESLGRVSDERLKELYLGARAFVFPAYEDAGIMTLEALSCGTPVIGLGKGGTAEFIQDGRNGVLFHEQMAEDVARAVKRFENMRFDPAELRASALPYDKREFKQKILAICESA